jgi:hypothetical protein
MFFNGPASREIACLLNLVNAVKQPLSETLQVADSLLARSISRIAHLGKEMRAAVLRKDVVGATRSFVVVK